MPVTLSALLENLPDELIPPACEMIDSIVHDLNGPLSTFALELHLARDVWAEIDALGTARGQALAKLEALREICRNLEAASEGLGERVKGLAALRARLEIDRGRRSIDDDSPEK